MKKNPLRTNPRKLATSAIVLLASFGIINQANGAKPPSPPLSPTYRFVPLGTFGGLAANATAVNQLGQVVGSADLDMGSVRRAHAFLVLPEDSNGDGQPDRWFRDDDGNTFNDLMVDLGVAAGFEGQSSLATDVNDVGQVVVNCHVKDNYVPLAFVITPQDVNLDGQPEWFWPGANGANALMTRLDFGPAIAVTDSQAKGINRSGQVVGIYNNGRGFLINALDTDQDGVADTWYQDSNEDGVNDLLVDLGLGGASGINDVGQVVGSGPFIITPTIGTSGSQVWNVDDNQDGINDLVINLPVLVTGTRGWALGLNAAGAVVGWAKTSAGVPHAMLWRVEAQGRVTTTDLGLLKNEAEAWATAVNDNLQVAGLARTYYMRKRYITESAFLWQNGAMSDLRLLVDQGALLTDRNMIANDISNQGLIVGYARSVDYLTSGPRYPFIAVPIR